ncbi:MAG: hypothetical protein GEV07_00525 [Streptosporangiales bacterium]|nr:hypothetical protein [Streptosporangiales bacterium]
MAEAVAGQRVKDVLPVLPPLRGLLPAGGLRPGSVTTVDDPTLLLALAAGPTAAGGWAALVGMPECGLVAVAELGVATDRLLLVDDAGRRWPEVVAALLDGVTLVAVWPAGEPPPAVARRLVALARRHEAALLVAGAWAGAEVNLSLAGSRWYGVADGHGQLTRRHVTVTSAGRGSAARAWRTPLWLPDANGTVREAAAEQQLTPLPYPAEVEAVS